MINSKITAENGKIKINNVKILYGTLINMERVTFKEPFTSSPTVILSPRVALKAVNEGYTYYSATLDIDIEGFTGAVWFIHNNKEPQLDRDMYSWVAIGT